MIDAEDIMYKLHPELTNHPEFDLTALLQYEAPIEWRPLEIGDTVWGRVLRVYTQSRTDYSYPVVELMNSESRIVRVKCSGIILRNSVHEQGISSGMIASFRFDGIKTSKEGRDYRTFTVKSIRS